MQTAHSSIQNTCTVEWALCIYGTRSFRFNSIFSDSKS